METAHEKITLKNAGNRIFRIDPLPRGKMAEVLLQKSKNGLTSADVLNYLREDASDQRFVNQRSVGDPNVSLF
ncbi:hypothetical protein AGMMS50293_24720 [Spirochaetia bacterium]|nr:hypothetical protein AGMMS50293_24720 [Spirochaetia bacterium]